MVGGKTGKNLLRFQIKSPEIELLGVLLVLDGVCSSRLRALVKTITCRRRKVNVDGAFILAVARRREKPRRTDGEKTRLNGRPSLARLSPGPAFLDAGTERQPGKRPKTAPHPENSIIQQELGAIEQIGARPETEVIESCHFSRATERFELRATAVVSRDRFTKPVLVPGINPFRAGVPWSATGSVVTNPSPPTASGCDAADHGMQWRSKNPVNFDYRLLDLGVQLGLWRDGQLRGGLLSTNGPGRHHQHCRNSKRIRPLHRACLTVVAPS